MAAAMRNMNRGGDGARTPLSARVTGDVKLELKGVRYSGTLSHAVAAGSEVKKLAKAQSRVSWIHTLLLAAT